jgi:flagellar assembly protein FliH
MSSWPEASGWSPPDLDSGMRSAAASDGPVQYPELSRRGAGSPALASSEPDVVQAAWTRGYAVGVAEAASGAEAGVQSALKALQGVVEHLEFARASMERDWKPNLFSLALAIARKLVQREVRAEPEIVLELVNRAIQLIPLDTTLEIRLNPSDLAVLGDRLERALPADRALSVRWVSDPSLDHGAFVIETPQRVVDGRADVALRTLYDRLDDD